MKQKNAAPPFSETIREFCRVMDQARRDFDWNYNEVHRLDQLTQDYLHKLELNCPDYKERAKIATQLAHCRQERRLCKDTVQTLDPLIQFLDSEKGKNLLNLMREALGKTRKIEENMKLRTYRPRVLQDGQ